MAFTLIRIVDFISTIFVILILAHVILSYIMAPWHEVRRLVDRIVEPMLTPIRRYVRPMGGFDFSSLILLILVQVVEYLIKLLIAAVF